MNGFTISNSPGSIAKQTTGPSLRSGNLQSLPAAGRFNPPGSIAKQTTGPPLRSGNFQSPITNH